MCGWLAMANVGRNFWEEHAHGTLLPSATPCPQDYDGQLGQWHKRPTPRYIWQDLVHWCLLWLLPFFFIIVYHSHHLIISYIPEWRPSPSFWLWPFSTLANSLGLQQHRLPSLWLIQGLWGAILSLYSIRCRNSNDDFDPQAMYFLNGTRLDSQ